MLTPFPELLSFTFFAPTLLRVAAALSIAYLAYYHFKNRDSIAKISFPIVGTGMWIPWLMFLIEVAVAACFFVGYYTQYATILGLAIALKDFVWRKRHPSVFPLSRSASFLLFMICLSLLLTGAGALAFDIPL